MFENVDNTQYIQTTEAYLSYKLTTEPKGSDELKIIDILPLHQLCDGMFESYIHI